MAYQDQNQIIQTTKLDPVILRDFSGGVNNSVSNALMPPNALRFALNMYSDPQKAPYGSLVSRLGVLAVRNVNDDMSLNLLQSNIIGLFSSRNNKILIGVYTGGDSPGTFIYYSADYTSSFVNTGAIPFNWTGTGSQSIRFVQFIGYTFACNGIYIKSWDGVVANNWGATNLTGAPVGNLIEEFQGRLYVSQNTTYTSRVYFSSVPDKTTNLISWNTTNDWFDVANNDGDEIVAMKKFNNILLIWKRKSLYAWDGATLSFIASIGTISQENIQIINDKVFFVSLKDTYFEIYMYFGGIVQRISDSINNWLHSETEIISMRIPADNLPRGYDNSLLGAWSDDNNYFILIGNINRIDIFSKDIKKMFTTKHNTFQNVILRYNISTNTWNELSINSANSDSANLWNSVQYSTKIFLVTNIVKKINILAGKSGNAVLTATSPYSLSPWYWDTPFGYGSISSYTEDRIAKTTGASTFQYVPISIYIQTREEEFGSRSRIKTLNNFNVFADGAYNNMTLGIRVDGKKWIELGKLTDRVTKFSFIESGHFFEFKIYGETFGGKGDGSNPNINQQFIFEGFEFYDVDIEGYET